MNSREAAYLALLKSLKEEGFIADFLESWDRLEHPSPLEYAFAFEIAAGSARMALSLDYIASQLTSKGKLSLKLKEKALLRTAIYQHVYMEKVPLYAIVDETMQIAKKHCHSTFCSFLNALLRKLGEQTPSLPTGNSIEDLSVRLSYPAYYVKELIDGYGEDKAIEILEAGNLRPKTSVRIRPGGKIDIVKLEPYSDEKLPLAFLKDRDHLKEIASSTDYYIQNGTPVALFNALQQHLSKKPQTILDLCASPGGKLLLAHDTFPEAELSANDVSVEKLKKIEMNLKKYGVQAHLRSGLGEEYPLDQKFDLVILDVPCSNSGVLNRRPEARWRLSESQMKETIEEQKKLLRHAEKLLSPNGAIFYMTCSIIKSENELLVESIPLTSSFQLTILPNREGWDGGFGCLLMPN